MCFHFFTVFSSISFCTQATSFAAIPSARAVLMIMLFFETFLNTLRIESTIMLTCWEFFCNVYLVLLLRIRKNEPHWRKQNAPCQEFPVLPSAASPPGSSFSPPLHHPQYHPSWPHHRKYFVMNYLFNNVKILIATNSSASCNDFDLWLFITWWQRMIKCAFLLREGFQ